MIITDIFKIFLLLLLIACAVSVNLTSDLLRAVIIFMSYSSIMCIVWVLMESPDLAITEAAVGAGISGTLFLLTLKKIRAEDAGTPDEAEIARQDAMYDLISGEETAMSSVDEAAGVSHEAVSGNGWTREAEKAASGGRKTGAAEKAASGSRRTGGTEKAASGRGKTGAAPEMVSGSGRIGLAENVASGSGKSRIQDKKGRNPDEG